MDHEENRRNTPYDGWENWYNQESNTWTRARELPYPEKLWNGEYLGGDFEMVADDGLKIGARRNDFLATHHKPGSNDVERYRASQDHHRRKSSWSI